MGKCVCTYRYIREMGEIRNVCIGSNKMPTGIQKVYVLDMYMYAANLHKCSAKCIQENSKPTKDTTAVLLVWNKRQMSTS